MDDKIRIRETMNILASGTNLAAKWRDDCAGYATEEYRLDVLNQYFNDAIKMLAPLVDGHLLSEPIGEALSAYRCGNRQSIEEKEDKWYLSQKAIIEEIRTRKEQISN